MRAVYTLLLSAPLLGSVACGEEEEGDNHGYVTMTLKRLSGSGDDNPFTGTAQVQIALDYGADLVEFYNGSGNLWANDGPQGAEVFANWENRLCDPGLNGVNCTVLEIGQALNAPGAGSSQLRVLYEVSDDIELQTFYIGPIPTDAMLGSSSIVSMNTSGVQGLNGEGEVVWVAKSYDPPDAGPAWERGFAVEVGEP